MHQDACSDWSGYLTVALLLWAIETAEMLECSWVAKEGSPTSTWRNVALLLAPRAHHGVCFFEGKLFAAGGKVDATVECFTLPSIGNEMGQ